MILEILNIIIQKITPIKWTDTGSSVRPTVGRDLSNVNVLGFTCPNTIT